MTIEGKLEGGNLPAVLQQIGRQHSTGILTLQGEEEIIGVTFLAGEVVSVDAVNQAPEEGMGRVLAERGLVGEGDFAALMAENQAGGGRVADLLVERGHVSREQLLDVMRMQTLSLCSEALSWDRGRFRFYTGDEVSYEEGMKPIPVDELLRSVAGTGAPGAAPAASPAQSAGPVVVRLREAEALFSPPDETPALELPLEPYAPEYEEYDEYEEYEKKPGLLERLGGAFGASEPGPVLCRLLALMLAIALAVTLARAPVLWLMPLPTQDPGRASFAALERAAFYLKVDRGAKAFYLVEGRFPSSLDELVGRHLLAARDLATPWNEEVTYADAPVSYLVLLQDSDDPRAQSTRTETVSGHFLLDPDFVTPDVVDVAPLVLLD